MQNDTEEEAGPRESKRSLIGPASMLLSGFLIAGFVAGIIFINDSKTRRENPSKSANYTGVATVVSYHSSTKHCIVVLRHEDGEEVRHRMSRATCGHLELDAVIDIVDGQYDY